MNYFDLQVNGYAGVDFNSDDLSAESLRASCEKLRADGVSAVLSTIITAELDVMHRRLERIVKFRGQDPFIAEVIAGIHIEGPFISDRPGYVGAHPVSAVRPANVDEMKRLLEAADGLTRIVTLAPEKDADLRVTRMLSAAGIVVAAGHCDPSVEEIRQAIDAGLSMFTHLGNGCPMTLHRHDNIIQRTLSLADQLWISFIADGAHVPWPALGNYLRITGIDRAIVVTDAISAAGLGPGTYTIGDRQVTVGDDLVPWAADRSHFVGSATTMPRMAKALKDYLGFTEDKILRLTRDNPYAAIGEK